MGLSQSTYYDESGGQSIEEARLVERIKAICAEWPSYGYRRMTAELRATVLQAFIIHDISARLSRSCVSAIRLRLHGAETRARARIR